MCIVLWHDGDVGCSLFISTLVSQLPKLPIGIRIFAAGLSEFVDIMNIKTTSFSLLVVSYRVPNVLLKS